MAVFSVFDSFTVTDLGPSHAHAKGSGRVESAVGHGMYADAGAARRLANLPVGTLSEISSAVGDGLGRPLTRPETAPDSAIDQVLGAIVDTNSHDTLIGDLAFEQVSLGARKLRGNAAI